MNSLTTVVVVLTMLYTITLFIRSRRRRVALLPAPPQLFYVVLVPCLNEELVIGASLARLLAVRMPNLAVMVIDDGSDDRTPAIVREHDPEKVWLFRRELPEARRGKGEALNAAYHHLLSSGVLRGRSPKDVVVVVLDADGRIEPNAFFEVAPYFADPKAGAVQIGVRMYNAHESLLARMQDFEFVTFTEIFQRGRQRIGSVGLGGNGQFARLAALEALGPAPWTSCLTEDLDLGIRLWAAGWNNNYCPTTHVSQQAVLSVRRLIRQRSRWFHGHLQCWARLPTVLTARRPWRARLELVHHLLSPALLLAMSVPIVLFFVTFTALLITAPIGTLSILTSHHGLLLIACYALALGLAPFYSFAYWLRTKATSFPRALAYAHAFSVYSYLWLPAGWIAVSKVVRRQQGWAKTTRTADRTPAAS